jgi:hypothetical protein
MVENVVTRRVLESWLEVGFEEAAFSVFTLPITRLPWSLSVTNL